VNAVDPTRARGFDAWAGDYDRFRPGYPEELFETIEAKLTLPRQPHVVDLGAGTGLASLAMAGFGWRVTAVEPGRPMLELLRANATNQGLVVSTVQASAEATGLDPASADLVTAAQAFHWFDKASAMTEIARITRPGGGVALFWNVRDAERSPFLADYEDLLRRYMGTTDSGRYEWEGPEATRHALAGSAAFGEPALVQLHQEVAMTDEQFIGMAFTASYVRVDHTPEEQDRFRIALAGLLGRHGLNDGRPFAVPYRIDLWIATRNDR
jgi:SAM-dependent methyltransferase